MVVGYHHHFRQPPYLNLLPPPQKKKTRRGSKTPGPRWKIKLAESLLIFKTGKSTARLLSLIQNTSVAICKLFGGSWWFYLVAISLILNRLVPSTHWKTTRQKTKKTAPVLFKPPTGKQKKPYWTHQLNEILMHRLSATFSEKNNIRPNHFPQGHQFRWIIHVFNNDFYVFRVEKTSVQSSASNNWTPSWMSGRFHQGTGTRPPRQRVETSPWARRSPRDAGREPRSLQPSWCFEKPPLTRWDVKWYMSTYMTLLGKDDLHAVYVALLEVSWSW